MAWVIGVEPKGLPSKLKKEQCKVSDNFKSSDNFNIQEELKKLPDKPGVYIMRDCADEIIYIGKAKVLKSRVRQYFQSSSQKNLKVSSMVPNIVRFEYIVTDTELEALILECNLIKKHDPKYNVLLKDDKSYPYIKLTTNEHFPRIYMVYKLDNDKAKYFGPYTSMKVIHETVDLVQSIWGLRRCAKVFPRDVGKGRPCLNYDIGQCHAPCALKIAEEQYDKLVAEVLSFLNGKHENIIERLTTEMQKFSDDLQFEKAADIRNKIFAVKRLKEKQKLDNVAGTDQDVIAFASEKNEAFVQLFFIRGGKMVGNESFMLNFAEETSNEEIMTGFIKQFYGETTYIPKEVLIQYDISDKELLTKWLSTIKGFNVTISVPQKGEKQRLVQLAAKNAQISLAQFGEQLRREAGRTIGALQEIQEAIGIDKKLTRIEAYDISNTMGYESVGSMVVFENGKPKRSDYRKFKIKYVIGANDYKSIEEVISRRFMRYKKEILEEGSEDYGKFAKLPDILFIDGGKGHVHAAKSVLDSLNISIPICGLVKTDKHRTRGLVYNDEEILLPPNSEGFKLITRIQDEVHRFAIEYHRKLREKALMRSVLDDVPGIGGTRKKALLKHFGSIEKVMRASAEELCQVDGMNKKAANAVYDFFRGV